MTFDSTGAVYSGADVTGLGQAAMKSTDGGKTWNPQYNQFFASQVTGRIMNVDPNASATVYTLPHSGDRIYKNPRIAGKAGTSFSSPQLER